MTVAEAAAVANRSKTVIRRWVDEGYLKMAYLVPGYNGSWLLDRTEFESKLPEILAEMATHRGGRGNKSSDANGQER